MNVQDGEVLFGEWLPDQAIYKNPGLTEARNCMPVDGGYKEFVALRGSDDAVGGTPLSAFATIDDQGDAEVYAGTATHLYEKSGATWIDRSGATYTIGANGYWQFAQFENRLIATNYSDVPQQKIIGAPGNFGNLATTGTAPNARHVGIINRFVVLGDLDISGAVPYAVQWSAINDPTNWPTPNTPTARTVQSGRQLLDSTHGAVSGISNGQFYGLVYQKRGISRFTYVGGDVVFQVDTFEHSRGLWIPRSLAKAGRMEYFISSDGFYVTDGQSVSPIGDGKIDRWFFDSLDQTRMDRVTCGIDWVNKCILWSFPTASAPVDRNDRFIVYSFSKNRFSWAESPAQLVMNSYTEGYTIEQLDSLFDSIDDMTVSLDSPMWQGGVPSLMGMSAGRLATFTGGALDAVFDTGEFDSNPFGFTFIRGVRPLVTGTPTSVTVALAARNTQDNAGRTWGPNVSRSGRTGICGFRKNGRFLSSRMIVSGGFERAIGLQVDAEPGDMV